MQKFTHTHKHKYTNTHTHTHKYTNTHTNTNTHTHTHTQTHTNTHTQRPLHQRGCDTPRQTSRHCWPPAAPRKSQTKCSCTHTDPALCPAVGEKADARKDEGDAEATFSKHGSTHKGMWREREREKERERDSHTHARKRTHHVLEDIEVLLAMGVVSAKPVLVLVCLFDPKLLWYLHACVYG